MVLFKDNEFPDGDRFIIHYEEDGFETYVEVFPDLSTKCYHTVFSDKKRTLVEKLQQAAEEVAVEECIKKYYY